MAEYRTITKEEIVSILADPRGNPARLENLATDFNSSWDMSWESFANITVPYAIWNEQCEGIYGNYVTTSNSGWDVVIPSSQPNATASVTYDDYYNDCVNITSNGSQAYMRENEILSGVDCGIQCDIIADGSETGGIFLGIYDPIRNVEVYIFNSSIYAHDDATWFKIMDICPFVWYEVRIMTNYIDNTYRLLVDGDSKPVNGTIDPAMFTGSGSESQYVGIWTIPDYNATSWVHDFYIFDGNESVRNIGGRYMGAVLPESRARHNVTGNQFSIGTLFTFGASDIGPCASEMWVRSPIQFQEGMDLLLQIWAVSGSSFIDATSVTAEGPDLLPIGNARLIWEWTYDLNYHWTTNNTLNRTYCRVTAPFYPDKQYLASFTATSLTKDYVDVYWTQCDLFNDGQYLSYVWVGDGEPDWVELDPGISLLVISTSGGNMIGRELDPFTALSWSIDPIGTVINGTYLTFTMPFIVEDNAYTDITVYITGWNDTQPVWAMYDILYSSRSFVILSDEITGVANETYSSILVQVYFNGTKPVRIWLHDTNSRLLSDSDITTVIVPSTSVWSWTPLCSLRATDGLLGLYERPIIVYDAIWVSYTNGVTVEYSNMAVFLMPGNLAKRVIIAGLEYVGEKIILSAKQFYEWASSGLQYLWDRFTEALVTLSAWMWDHVGIHIYAIVSVIVNAFVDATITLIQIALVVIPLVIFAMLVNWYAKFLNSFKVWYTKGYEAYAEYLEHEMIHMLTVATRVRKSPISAAVGTARKEYRGLSESKGLERKLKQTIKARPRQIRRKRKRIEKKMRRRGLI